MDVPPQAVVGAVHWNTGMFLPKQTHTCACAYTRTCTHTSFVWTWVEQNQQTGITSREPLYQLPGLKSRAWSLSYWLLWRKDKHEPKKRMLLWNRFFHKYTVSDWRLWTFLSRRRYFGLNWAEAGESLLSTNKQKSLAIKGNKRTKL